MSRSKGPWSIKTPEKDTNAHDVYSADGVLIHRAYWGGKEDSLLISASPELLAALEAFVAYESGGNTAPLSALVENAKAAIAKAEGAK